MAKKQKRKPRTPVIKPAIEKLAEKTVDICSLQNGECFIFDGRLLMVVEDWIVDLAAGEYWESVADVGYMPVSPVAVEITWKRI